MRSAAYWICVGLAAALCVALCAGARRRPGRWTLWASRSLAVILAVDAVVFIGQPLVDGEWSLQYSLPLALCDVALVVACTTCWLPDWSLGVELTYFWGLAGTLQAVATPDLTVAFPHLIFFEFVVGHLGIVMAALYLVIGLRREPRRHAAARVFAITVGYTVALGVFDWRTHSNYMFLASRPATISLLSVLGPWPWYLLSAAGVAIVLFALLDAPFWYARRTRPPDHGNGGSGITGSYASPSSG